MPRKSKGEYIVVLYKRGSPRREYLGTHYADEPMFLQIRNMLVTEQDRIRKNNEEAIKLAEKPPVEQAK